MLSHTPVLLDEVLQFLNPHPEGRFIDATLGGGGHTRAILERVSPAGKVLAIDQDELAVAQAKSSLEPFAQSLQVVKANFRDIETVAETYGFRSVDGALADIGDSSMMLHDATRGFSFMREGKLDMRMDRS